MALGVHSLRQRVFSGVLLTTVSALLIAGTMMVAHNLDAYRKSLIRDTTNNAELIGFASTPALQFNDAELAGRTLDLLRTQPEIVAAAIYTQSGALFAHYRRTDENNEFPRLPSSDGYRIADERLELHYRIVANDEILGTVFLKAQYRGDELLLSQGLLMLSAAAVALVISMLLSYWLQARVTGPLLDIAKLAQRIARERDYTLRAVKSTGDEVGVLAESFNDLLAEIERGKNEMRAANESLQREVADRQQAEEEIQRLNSQLEARVEERTAELENVVHELEAFSYSVSHDLRSPLRAIDGFSQALLEDHSAQLDAGGLDYLKRVRGAAQRMGQLIDDLLKLSRINRSDFNPERIDLTLIAEEILAGIVNFHPERKFVTRVTSGMTDIGDPQLMRIALENLLENAVKYTSRKERTEIEFGMRNHEGKVSYFVQDNGAGFDMKYADKLFGAFQRLHDAREYPGTGIGLATVQRVIHRHGGAVWADAAIGKGATFYFTLNTRRESDEKQANTAG